MKYVYICPFYLSTFFVFCSVIGLTQPINTKLGDVSLPTPTAAALGQYVDVPVSYATGIPNIGVPIHTVRSGPLSLEVSLSYHAGGINVAMPASHVGVGWSLKAGGIISRTQRGLADETLVNGYIYDGDNLLSDPVNELEQLRNGNLDTEPDLFAFNFADYSGKFFFSGSGDQRIIQVEDQDIKLSARFFHNRIVGFIIIGTDGTKYYFGMQAEQDNDQDPAGDYQDIYETGPSINPQMYMSTWYLVRIESADGYDYINLSYEDEAYEYLTPVSVQETSYSFVSNATINDELFYECDASGGGNTIHSTSPNGYSYHRNVVYGKRLKSITSPLTTINLKYTTGRLDLLPTIGRPSHSAPKSLDEIEVLDGASGKYGKCVRFDLQYDYFKGDRNRDVSQADPQDSYRYRLRLDAVQQRSCYGTQELPPHSFTYRESGRLVDGYAYFPNRFSQAVDHWGYYNGVHRNNGKQLNAPPSRIKIEYNNEIYRDRVVGSSDRYTSELKYSVLGTIHTHHYPMGGYSVYDFENNTVQNLQDIKREQKNIYDFELMNCDSKFAPVNNDCQTAYNISTTYTILSADDLKHIKYQLYLPEAGYDGSQVANADLFVYEPGNNNPIALDEVDYYEGSSAKESDTGLRLLQDLIPNATVGTTYRFELVGYGSKAQVDLYDYDPVHGNLYSQPVGGLRIKSITTYESTEKIVSEKTYEYESSGLIGDLFQFSSGKLLRQPSYTFQFAVDGRQNNGNGTLFIGYDVTSSVKVPLTDFSGNHVVYSRVVERVEGSGSTTMLFDVRDPKETGRGTFPGTPAAPDFVRGRMKRKELRSDKNASVYIDEYKPEQSLTTLSNANNSGYQPAYTFHFFRVDASEACALTATGLGPWINPYNLYTGYGEMAEVKTERDGVVLTTSYTYGSGQNYRYPTQKREVDGNGRAVTTEYRYPEHYPDNSAYAAAANRNILAPVQTEISISHNSSATDQMVDGTKIVYDFFPNESKRHPYPKLFERYEATEGENGTWSGSWQLQGTITARNARGLPTGYRREGWREETYDWTPAGLIKSRSYTAATPDRDGIDRDVTLATTYHYKNNDESRLLDRIVAPDGQETEFFYDDLLRLERQSARGDNVETTYTYNLPGAAAVAGGQPNSITTTTTFAAPAGNAALKALTDLREQTTVEYFDGIGRSIQTVLKAHSDDDTPKDVITTRRYDERGRLEREYDPFKSGTSDGGYVATIPEELTYTYIDYYPDPLGCVRKTAHSDFDHPMEYTYGTNDKTVPFHPAQGGTDATYGTNSLYLTTVTDGNGNQTRTYTDAWDRQVLSERLDDGGDILSATYRTFDSRDRLRAVYPPLNNGEELTDNHIYRYTYDGRDNVLTKKIPDRPEETISYDARDLPIATERTGLPDGFTHLGTAYDGFGNPVRTGFLTAAPTGNDLTLADIPDDQLLTETRYGLAGDGLGKPVRTTERIMDGEALSETRFNTTNVYDNYGRLWITLANHHLNPEYSLAATTFFAYDLGDNVLQTISEQFTADGHDLKITEETHFDHAGRPTADYHQLTRDGTATPRTQLSHMDYTVRDEVARRGVGATAGDNFLQTLDFHYRGNGFLERINDPAALGDDLFALGLDYDRDETGAGAAAQRNGNISAMRVATATGVDHAFAYAYDGLDRLRTADQSDNNAPAAAGRYSTTYNYDKRGNLTTLTRQGRYGDPASPNFGQIDALSYAYDEDNTNLLRRVTDDTEAAGHESGYHAKLPDTDYAYDARGNTTTDPGNGTTVKYNYLDLPHTFTFEDGRRVRLGYTTAGQKLYELHLDADGNETQRRDYLQAARYEDGRLAMVGHAAGRVLMGNCIKEIHVGGAVAGAEEYEAIDITADASVLPTGKLNLRAGRDVRFQPGFVVEPGGYLKTEKAGCYGVEGEGRYEYFLADHLGNNRILFADVDGDGSIDPATEVLQENHYYAFGLGMEGAWSETPNQPTNSEENRYKFNGIERSEELGLDLAMFRSYDPAIGRWLQVDPMAELAPGWTPYRFGFNNPLRYIDPWGLFESRKQARQYRRTEKNGLNWFNSTITKQKDGSYAIETRTSSTQINQDGELASNFVVGTTADGQEVTTVALAAAPSDVSSGIIGGPDKIAPLGFWDRVVNNGTVGGGIYNEDGYYLRPAPLAGHAPDVGGAGKIKSAVKAVKRLRVPAGEWWIKIRRLGEKGYWGQGPGTFRGKNPNDYIRAVRGEAPPIGSASTGTHTTVGRANQYGKDMDELLRNASRFYKDAIEGGAIPGG